MNVAESGLEEEEEEKSEKAEEERSNTSTAHRPTAVHLESRYYYLYRGACAHVGHADEYTVTTEMQHSSGFLGT